MSSAGLKQEPSSGDVAMTPRSTEEAAFHKIFPQVPLTEKLVEDYACSYSKNKTLRQGRLYVTAVRLCFFAVTQESLHVLWQEVTNITKKQKLFVGVIDIETANGSVYSFTGFNYGVLESALKTMQMLVSVRSKYAPRSSVTQIVAPPAPAPAPPVPPTEPAVPVAIKASHENPTERTEPIHARTPSTPEHVSSRPSNGNDNAKHSTESIEKDTKDKGASSGTTGQPGMGVLSGSMAEIGELDNFSSTIPPSALREKSTSMEIKEVLSHADDVVAPPEGSNGSKKPTPTARPPEVKTPPSPSSQLPGPAVSTPRKQPHDDEHFSTVADMVRHQRTVSDTIRRTSPSAESLPPHPLSATYSTALPPLDVVLSPAPKGPASRSPPAQPITFANQPQWGSASFPPQSSPTASTEREPVFPESGPLSPSAQSVATPIVGEKAERKREEKTELERDKSQQAAKRRQSKRDGEFDSEAFAAQNKANLEILRNFPKVPKTENVLDQFQCSYVAGVHRIGKLYITQHYVLFNSMLLAESVTIPFTDVESIAKQQTVLILDGIVITLKTGERYEFTSFLSRDQAFSIMKQLFETYRATEQLLSRTATSKELRDPPSPRGQSPASQHAVPAVQAPRAAPSPPSTVSSLTAVPSSPAPAAPSTAQNGTALASGQGPAPTAVASPTGVSVTFRTPTALPYVEPERYPAVASVEAWDAYGTDFEFSPIATLLPSKVVLPEKQLPAGCDLNDVFRVCFDDDTKPNLEYHVSRNETENRWDPWKPCQSAERTPLPHSGQRVFNCITIIKALTATSCPFTEFQKYAFFNVNGTPTILIGLSGQARGVMYSETFRVEQVVTLTQSGSGSKAVVTMKATTHLRFLTSCWLKGKITSNTYSETQSGFQKLYDIMCTHLERDLEMRRAGLLQVPAYQTDAISVAPPAPTAAESPRLEQPIPLTRTPSQRHMREESPPRGPRPFTLPDPVRWACRVALAFSCMYLLSAIWSLTMLDVQALSLAAPVGASPSSLITGVSFAEFTPLFAAIRAFCLAGLWALAAAVPFVINAVEFAGAGAGSGRN